MSPEAPAGGFRLGPRRAVYAEVTAELARRPQAVSVTVEELTALEELDQIYRCLCALLFNYVPTSGHPGGSISSGRIVESLLFFGLDHELAQPDREDADALVYAAGHKALGLYALWALRDEVARIAAPELLPESEGDRLRLEDLLGFRRNPATATPLFTRFHAKPLDGHPTPATPFVRLATGASGVGLASGIGLALGAQDWFRDDPPAIHLVEGEGGLTPGRVAEALAAAGTLPLGNAVLHVDWNQSSIDSDLVCREGTTPGEYVQWDPAELAYLNDWNVVRVADGFDLRQVLAAQSLARSFDNGQPTAIVYRTIKGWRYGVEGRAAHGAGHGLCSRGFYAALAPLSDLVRIELPSCDAGAARCRNGAESAVVEECFWEALRLVRRALESRRRTVSLLAAALGRAGERLAARQRKPRSGAPAIDSIYRLAEQASAIPGELRLEPGAETTLRGELGRVLDHYNRASGGAFFGAAADLVGSTSLATLGAGFPGGFYQARNNPNARLLALGGICEDAICGICSGLSTFGRHVGVASSYGAFIAPLGHIAARLHAIGNQAARVRSGRADRPFFLVCAHAGLETGEDGPTHADPQALQLLQEDFPDGALVTLTPWEPQEIWPLVSVALARRPAVIAPFVTRPGLRVPDRAALGLAPASRATQGLYALRRGRSDDAGVVVLQGSGVTYAFVEDALPLLDRAGVDLHVYVVTSAELFDRLPSAEQDAIFPPEHAQRALGVTGFTPATMWRWVTSAAGRRATLHPFREVGYLGSGPARAVLAEAGLDGKSQAAAILRYLAGRRPAPRGPTLPHRPHVALH